MKARLVAFLKVEVGIRFLVMFAAAVVCGTVLVFAAFDFTARVMAFFVYSCALLWLSWDIDRRREAAAAASPGDSEDHV